MKHYVYRISNILTKKHYYGVRTSKCSPVDDLGLKYFSSSTDDVFMSEQKTYPELFKYKIIKKFNTREEANEYEIKLHKKFNVSHNEAFYNKSERTSTRWVSYGKVSVIDNLGKTFQVSVDNKSYTNGTFKSVVTGKVNAINKITQNKITVSTNEYYNDNNLICNNTGRVPVVDSNSNKFLIDQNEYDRNNFKHVSCGLV